MELLVPGIWVLLGAVVVAFGIVPRLGPTMVLLVATAMLGVGVYHHYKLFHNEYRLATWSDKIRTYGPAVMIVAMVLFILGFIFSLFGGASVPLPNMNSMVTTESPEEESVADSPAASESPLETLINTVKEGAENVANAARRGANNLTRNVRFNTSAANNNGYNNRNYRDNSGNSGNSGNRGNRNRNNYGASFYSEI